MRIKTHLDNMFSISAGVIYWQEYIYRSQRGSQDDGSLVLPDFPEDKEERDRSGEAHQDVGEEVKDGGGDPPQSGRVGPLQVNTRGRESPRNSSN